MKMLPSPDPTIDNAKTVKKIVEIWSVLYRARILALTGFNAAPWPSFFPSSFQTCAYVEDSSSCTFISLVFQKMDWLAKMEDAKKNCKINHLLLLEKEVV
jgi:hypothetical protein